MSIELKIPSAGESISEVTIIEWLKPMGSQVRRDETVAIVETDKANVEIVSPVDGVLTRILHGPGEVVKVGMVIGHLEEQALRPAPLGSALEAEGSVLESEGSAVDALGSMLEAGSRPIAVDPEAKRSPRKPAQAAPMRPEVRDAHAAASAASSPPAASSAPAARAARAAPAAPAARAAPAAPAAREVREVREVDEASKSRDVVDDHEVHEARDRHESHEGQEGHEGAHPETVRAWATPAIRRALRAADLAPEDVRPSSAGGRITLGDVAATASSEGRAVPSLAPPAPRTMPTLGDRPRAASGDRGPPAPEDVSSRREEVVPMTPLRRRIAERLLGAQHSAALLTTFNEVDMSAILALRVRVQDRFTKKHGVKLGFMSFFVKAVVEALKEIPALNAEIRGDQIVYKHYYDIGVAVGGGRGLVVPVVRNVDSLSFSQVEQQIADYAARARDNRLKVEELQGGTFTVSNGGVYGSLLSTPIINPPQSGILGMHAVQDRPVVRDGQVVPAKMMYVALTYDHRLVDGREAVTFLIRVKEHIEDPTRFLLEV